MSGKNILLLVVCGALMATVATGCGKKKEGIDYSKQLPPGAHALRKITDPAMLPDYSAGFPTSDVQRQQLLRAIDFSLAYYEQHPSSQKFFPVQEFTHAGCVATLKAFRQIVETARTPEEMKLRVTDQFDCYISVGCDDAGTVLFTGYYQPILLGSRVKTIDYQYPLYRLPTDLVKDANGACLGRRLPDGQMVPYPTRAEIENSQLLAGQELVWLKEKFDGYIAHVQGSAMIYLTDGSWLEIGYAGKNVDPQGNPPYFPVAKQLVEDGKVPATRLSLAAVRQYFKEHPEEIDHYCQMNQTFVFFTEATGGPFGSLGQPVTPYRTLATDKSVFPRGGVTFVSACVPVRQADQLVGTPFNQFMLDQDTGGAIRAAGRADIFIGIGAEAGQIAGWTGSEGKLYYLLIKGTDQTPAPAIVEAR